MTGFEFLLPALMGAGEMATAAAPVMGAAQSIAPIASVAGTGLSVLGTIAGVDAASAAAKAQAAQERRAANAEMVKAAQKAEAEQKKKEYMLSSQRARFGASGGGTGGTAAEIMGDTEAQGNLNSELELWQGKERATAYLDEAKMKLFDAKQQQKTMPLKIGSQIISGVGGLAKYGGSSGYGDTLIDASYDPDSNFYTNTYKSSPYRYS